MAGVGDDDVVVWGLGGGIDELPTERVEADVELGGDGDGRGEDRIAKNGTRGVEVGLVDNGDDGLGVANGDVGIGHSGFCHQQDDGGALDGGQRTVDAKALDLVGGVADACCVDEAEGDAAELDGVFDGVAGSALYVTDDGALFAEEGVEEGGLAHVGSTDNGYRNAVFEGIASMEGVGEVGDMGIDTPGEFQQLSAVGKFEVFVVGEVEFQFEEGG